MAKPRNDNVKELIIQSAELLIQDTKLSEISLAMIATQAKISKGTLYYYYKSKDEILFDVADRFYMKQWEELVTWSQDKNKDTSIHRLIMYVMERAIKNSAVRLHLIFDAISDNNVIKEKLTHRYSDFIKLISQTVQKRIDFDGDYIAWLIILVCDGINIQQQLQNNRFDFEKFIDKTVTLVKEYVTNNPKKIN